MHLLFVDESGTPPKPGKTHPRYFVMAGIAMPEASWAPLRDDLDGMKRRRKLRGEIKWRHFAPTNDDATNPLRRLDQSARDEVREEIFRIIVKARHKLTAIAGVCSTAAAYEISSISGPDDIYHLTYKVITERFQYHLQDLGTRSQPERGIVVCDHRGADNDKRLRRHHQMLIHAPGGPTSVYKNLIEGLFLQPSHQSIGIQLADLVAGAIWRKFERSDSRFYDLVEPIMRRSKLGEVDGYGIARVPKRGWA